MSFWTPKDPWLTPGQAFWMCIALLMFWCYFKNFLDTVRP